MLGNTPKAPQKDVEKVKKYAKKEKIYCLSQMDMLQ